MRTSSFGLRGIYCKLRQDGAPLAGKWIPVDMREFAPDPNKQDVFYWKIANISKGNVTAYYKCTVYCMNSSFIFYMHI